MHEKNDVSAKGVITPCQKAKNQLLFFFSRTSHGSNMLKVGNDCPEANLVTFDGMVQLTSNFNNNIMFFFFQAPKPKQCNFTELGVSKKLVKLV